ncbi:MAG: hypothetical protein IT335_13970, partial [Thermomicrobiales bacterium]|nr:hypothetical protein [Thermomicrobiales bacterium]
VAADICGFGNLGTLEPGKAARAVGLSANPLESVQVWTNPVGVLTPEGVEIPFGGWSFV